MDNNYNYKGKLNLILGCMFSGKTSELINRYNRYTLGGKKCIMIKYHNDVRYDAEQIVSHDGIKVKAFRCQYLYEFDETVQNYDVVCIDEVQFYKDAHIICDRWANKGKIVEVCGLNGTFERKPFDVISKLVPLASDITFLTAICKETGKHGLYSQRTSDETEEEVIGGSDKYRAADRITFFKNVDTTEYNVSTIKDLVKTVTNQSISDDQMQDLNIINIMKQLKN